MIPEKKYTQNLRTYPAILGMSSRGCSSLSTDALEILNHAQVLAGKKEFLSFFPDFAHERVELPMKNCSVMETMKHLTERSQENNLVILASGDPNFYGIARLAKRYWKDFQIIPSLSCMQFAFARINESWQDAVFHSVHGRGKIFGLASRLRNEEKACILTDPDHTPAKIAKHLLRFHQEDWSAFVCENLNTPAKESITHYGDLRKLAELSEKTTIFATPNLLILLRKKNAANSNLKTQRKSALHLPETAYHRKVFQRGLITKTEVRILSIASMELSETSVVWDVGAASGSIAIEAGRWAKKGTVYAIETDEDCLLHLHENIHLHQADNVQIIPGMAPAVLDTITESPDGIFIGGSKGNLPEIIHTCYKRLRRPGKLVVNAVTLENIAICVKELKALANQSTHIKSTTSLKGVKSASFSEYLTVQMVQISRAVPLSIYLRYDALNPIHIFSLTKPALST